MKIQYFLFLALLSTMMWACENKVEETTTIQSETTYNAKKAKAYGADEYGMKKYVIAFLKRGPNRDRPKEEADALQKAHMENINRMAEEGKLVVAGPFLGDGDLRGIYIFDVSTLAEAEALTNTDPAIKAGSLVLELKEWYCSAALMAVNDIHNTLVKTDVMESVGK